MVYSTTVTWPGNVTDIIPPQAQMSFEFTFTAGRFLIKTLGFPGAQGAGILGMHGIGVSTPMAAEVAAATVGFAKDIQFPKGIMFSRGLLSAIFAAGCPPVVVILSGKTTNDEGAIPIEHIKLAPLHTNCDMIYKYLVF